MTFKYTAFYCEENIWHLANNEHFRQLESKVVLITGPGGYRKLWFQNASDDESIPVYWDYHVVLLAKDKTWQVWDLDTTLDLPVDAPTYFQKTFGGPENQLENSDVLFRVIDKTEYVKNFCSDRSHMILPNGKWAAPLPNWPAIMNNVTPNLDSWLNIKSDGPGMLLTLEQAILLYK